MTAEPPESQLFEFVTSDLLEHDAPAAAHYPAAQSAPAPVDTISFAEGDLFDTSLIVVEDVLLL